MYEYGKSCRREKKWQSRFFNFNVIGIKWK